MRTKVEFLDEYGKHPVILFIPEVSDIETLIVGDLAPNVFGKMAEVTEIFGRGIDIHGTPFVCYYTKNGSGTISASMKAGELVRTLGVTAKYRSADIPAIEDKMVNDFIGNRRCA